MKRTFIFFLNPNFKSFSNIEIVFVATMQDYIDSMEGATLSGRQAAAYICIAGEELASLQKKLVANELSLV